MPLELKRRRMNYYGIVETRRVVVRGRVQGVGFRWFVVRSARDLGVQGTVRNCEDGAVEVLLQARPQAVEALIARLHEGPAGARVRDVEVEAMSGPLEIYEGMRVLH